MPAPTKRACAAQKRLRGAKGTFVSTKPTTIAPTLVDLGPDVLSLVVAKLGIACGPMAHTCAMAAAAAAELKPLLWLAGCAFGRWRFFLALRLRARAERARRALTAKITQTTPELGLVRCVAYGHAS